MRVEIRNDAGQVLTAGSAPGSEPTPDRLAGALERFMVDLDLIRCEKCRCWYPAICMNVGDSVEDSTMCKGCGGATA